MVIPALVLGPVQFDRPEWLALIPVLGVLCWWIARRSLAGLGVGARRAALAARVLVIAAIAGAMSEPALRRASDEVAVIVVMDASKSIPLAAQRGAEAYLDAVRDRGDARTDRVGLVTVAREAFVQNLPGRLSSPLEFGHVGRTDSTHLAAGLRLAIAAAGEDAAHRVLLISDGNETMGSLLSAAEAARASGVPVDVLAVEYEHGGEVVAERVIAPAHVRGGETINLSVVLSATEPTAGRLSITESGETIDLDPASPTTSLVVELDAGKNILSVPVLPGRPGAVVYEAVFEPLAVLRDDGRTVIGDTIADNNRASTVTFVGSEGWVLLVGEGSAETGPLGAALEDAGLRLRTARPDAMPTDLTGLSAFDAVVIVNQPAYAFSEAQQAALRSYVHDAGGGLVMTGGPDAFGAGGWIGSTLEDALPVRLDPPQKRQLPMGGLALVIDASGSMGSWVSGTAMNQIQLANEAAVAAVETLSRLDQITVISFSGSPSVEVPLTTVGDPAAIARRIRAIGPGGGTNMFPAMEAGARELSGSPAGVRHMIVLSDGHTMGSDSDGYALAARLFARGVTISTIAVGDGANEPLLRGIAASGGGRYYKVQSNSQALVTLPQIFMKEAQTVRRSLIWEGDPFRPALSGVPTETMRGIASVPPITGYVVTAEREGLAQVTLKAAQQNPDGTTIEDPIAAQWQYGLGRSMVFTSDASTRWASSWVAWGGYQQFWAQQVRWAMRPAGSANVRVITEERGEQTAVIIEALDESGERLNFASFLARVVKPDASSEPVRVRQTGPGRYEGVLPTAEPGSYVVTMQYDAPGEDGVRRRGSAQASITRGGADEFRALETNRALLRQVAALTGGAVLTGDPAQDRPWRREGLTRPVSTRAIWLAAALAGVGLFLGDVAIRRVRVEPAAIGRVVARAFGRSPRASAGDQIDSLRVARAKARARMDEPLPAEEQVAARKFEGEPEPGASQTVLSGQAETPAIATGARENGTKPPEEEGMSRLLRAKRRAAEEFGEDERTE